MKPINMALTFILSVLLLGISTTADGREPPVAKLVQVEGEVEYSRDGNDWRAVRRTKYLFPGYQVRTGDNGGGKFINQKSGLSQELGANTHVEVEDDKIAVLSGSLSKPEEESVSIWESLVNKFTKAQRYTTVRRNVWGCDDATLAARKITVTDRFPEIVWINPDESCSYVLSINGEEHRIEPSDARMIRFDVSDFEPGDYEYSMKAIGPNGEEYVDRLNRTSTVVVLDDEAEAEINDQLDAFGDDALLRFEYLEEKGLNVAAMDEIRSYLDENPFDHELRPLLIKSYAELRLGNLKDSEVLMYNEYVAAE